MRSWFADFHIHIGRAGGRPVKMAAAPSLTLTDVLDHARRLKGLDVITVIDGVCSGVLSEVRKLVADGRLVELKDGGCRFENGLAVLLGAEVEIAGPEGGAAHFGCWLPSIAAAEDFQRWLASVQKNVSLSSQRARTDARLLQREVQQRNGLFIVHHAFTPHKGIYGNCVSRLADMVDPEAVDAIELGLSADTEMADGLRELARYTFLSNSDAHSLPKIAREYNVVDMDAPSFAEVRKALRREAGRRVRANYGLHPALGKYYRTFCLDCEQPWPDGADHCACGGTRRVLGVRDRLLALQDQTPAQHPDHRGPYIHQIPLEFVPGLGAKLRGRLLDAFGTEMIILHEASVEDLAKVVGESLAKRIDDARRGRVGITAGSGGIYGKLTL
ncbi:MAG: endonuclease Q family protein [Alicyclobacillus sp.]|nr:endonuclease Q family protein [Alicyclobacillus sp.]